MDKQKLLIIGALVLCGAAGGTWLLWPEPEPEPEPEPVVEQEMDEIEQQDLMMAIGYIQQDEDVLDAMDGAEAQD
jgi:hypothetical protein